jgi:hypothetical protein
MKLIYQKSKMHRYIVGTSVSLFLQQEFAIILHLLLLKYEIAVGISFSRGKDEETK